MIAAHVPHEEESIETIFNRIATGPWIEGDCESVSGPGSTISYTRHFRSGLAKLLAAIDCKSLLDAPCGDFNWMKEVKFPAGMRYFGGDIVSQIVEQNKESFGSDVRYFMQVNILRDPLPDADIWLCRDCLFHLSLEQAMASIRNGLRSNYKYYMFTSHFNRANEDIGAVGFRELNLEIAPFFFPRPIGQIIDFVEGWPPRHVGIWTRDQVLGSMISDHPI